MKSIILVLFLFGIGFVANAQSQLTFNDDHLQYAIIKDSDGFVNIRKAPDKTAPIVGKIYKYSVFSCEPNKTNWWKILQVDEHDKSYWLEGYIYKDRVSLLNGWKVLKKRNAYVDSGVFKNDSIKIVVKTSAFRPKDHKLLYKEKELIKIDGKLFWGTDGEIPKKKISSVRIINNDRIITLPKNAFGDLYQPNLDSISICSGPDKTFYISMLNSDGAGGYYIIWVLKDNNYLNRYIDDSEE